MDADTLTIIPATAPDSPAPVFSAPVPTTPSGPTHPGVLGVLPDGSMYLLYVSQDNRSLRLSYNQGGTTPFTDVLVDTAPAAVGNPKAATDALGRLHFAWYHGLPNGAAEIRYARHDPGTPSGMWTRGPFIVAGSQTGPTDGGAHKVVGLACNGAQAVVMWSRNTVGARYATTDDGAVWSLVERVPGPFSPTAVDFDLGVIKSGLVWACWMDREHGIVAKQHTRTAWSPEYHVSAGMPGGGQAYTPRAVGLPDGNLAFLWTGPSTDGFCRIFDHVRGLLPTVTRLWQDDGTGDSRGLTAVVAPDGALWVAWDDWTGRLRGDLASLVIHGNGTTFSAPQNAFPTLGEGSCNRYPALAIAGGRLYVSTNSNAHGSFINYVASVAL